MRNIPGPAGYDDEFQLNSTQTQGFSSIEPSSNSIVSILYKFKLLYLSHTYKILFLRQMINGLK